MNPDNLILYQVILLHNDLVEGMLYDYPKEIKEIFLDKVSIIINEEK
jgi:hypothetical protein